MLLDDFCHIQESACCKGDNFISNVAERDITSGKARRTQGQQDEEEGCYSRHIGEKVKCSHSLDITNTFPQMAGLSCFDTVERVADDEIQKGINEREAMVTAMGIPKTEKWERMLRVVR